MSVDPLLQAYISLVMKTYNTIPFYRQTTTIKGVGLNVVDLQCVIWKPVKEHGCSVRSYLSSAYRVIQGWDHKEGV